jgi:hypothetical protein
MAYHVSPIKHLGHATAKLAHFLFHCVTFTIITAALAVAFRNHDETPGVPNVESIHEFMGMLSQWCCVDCYALS